MRHRGRKKQEIVPPSILIGNIREKKRPQKTARGFYSVRRASRCGPKAPIFLVYKYIYRVFFKKIPRMGDLDLAKPPPTWRNTNTENMQTDIHETSCIRDSDCRVRT